MTYVILIAGLLFPSILALVDCIQRDDEEFVGGGADRQAWIRWLAIGVPLCLVLVGYGILLGYYWGVVKRAGPHPG